MIILDTTVVSELMRAKPAPSVLTWLDRRAVDELFTTAITVAEIRYGIARLDSDSRNLSRPAGGARYPHTKDFRGTGIELIDPWQDP